MKSVFQKISFLFIVLIASSIFLFAWVKASTSSFTHDEGVSYRMFPHDSFMEILNYSNSFNNNHLLNSMGMKYAEILFGSSELALRLPNLMAFLLYMFYAFFFFRKSQPFIMLGAFALLCSNIYMVDYFSLARGYGLSFGFVLMSLYHYIAYLKCARKRDLVVFHLAGLFACLSSFTAVPYYLALVMSFVIFKVLEGRCTKDSITKVLQHKWVHLISFAFSVAILYEPVRRLIKFNVFQNGGTLGVYHNTVGDMVKYGFNYIFMNEKIVLAGQVLFTLFILLGLFLALRKWSKTNLSFSPEEIPTISTALILFSVTIILSVQHMVLGSAYPIGRFILVFLPVLFIGLMSSLELLYKQEKTLFIPLFFVLLGLCSLWRFCNKIDYKSYMNWSYDAHTKEVMQYIASENKGDELENSITLEVSWVLEPTSNYYRLTRNMSYLNEVTREETFTSGDYVYVLTRDTTKVNLDDFTVIKKYMNPNRLFLKRTN